MRSAAGSSRWWRIDVTPLHRGDTWKVSFVSSGVIWLKMPNLGTFLRMLGNDWNRSTEDVSLCGGCSRSVQSSVGSSRLDTATVHPGPNRFPPLGKDVSSHHCMVQKVPLFTGTFHNRASRDIYSVAGDCTECFVGFFFPLLKIRGGVVP